MELEHAVRLREELEQQEGLPEVQDQGFAWLSVDGVSDVEAYEAELGAMA